MRRPDFGAHEHFVAPDSGGPDSVAHLALVLVNLRGVDVAIAKLERLLHQACAGSSEQLPRAKPDRRDFCAASLNELHHGLSRKLAKGKREKHVRLHYVPRRSRCQSCWLGMEPLEQSPWSRALGVETFGMEPW